MRLLTKLLGSSVLLFKLLRPLAPPALTLIAFSVLELNLTIIVEFILARFAWPVAFSTDIPEAYVLNYIYCCWP